MYSPCARCENRHNTAFCSQNCEFGKTKAKNKMLENQSSVLLSLLSASHKTGTEDGYGEVVEELQAVISDSKHKPDVEKIVSAIEATNHCRELATPYTIEELRKMGQDAIDLWSASKSTQKIRVESLYTEDATFFAETKTDTPPEGYYEIQPRTNGDASMALLCKYTGLGNSIELCYSTYGRTWQAFPA